MQALTKFTRPLLRAHIAGSMCAGAVCALQLSEQKRTLGASRFDSMVNADTAAGFIILTTCSFFVPPLWPVYIIGTTTGLIGMELKVSVLTDDDDDNEEPAVAKEAKKSSKPLVVKEDHEDRAQPAEDGNK